MKTNRIVTCALLLLSLLTAAGAIQWVPKWLETRGQNASLARAGMLPFLGLFTFVHLFVYGYFYADKTVTLGRGDFHGRWAEWV